MATYLGSWKIVYTRPGFDGTVPDLGSVEQAFYVGNPDVIPSIMKDIAKGIRTMLRTDPKYRQSCGIDVTKPEFLNVVFQPPLSKIDIVCRQ